MSARIYYLALSLLAVRSPAVPNEDGAFAERATYYRDGPMRGHGVSVWNMAHAESAGGSRPDARHLWFNHDWRAAPWAGMAVRGGEATTLTQPWIDRGFFRFLLNSGMTRYGEPAGALAFQVKLEGASDGDFQRVRARHIDRGRGRDEDPASWQEVLVPLRYWTGLSPGEAITGISIQTVGQAELAFGVDEIELIRYATLPDWFVRERSRPVLQKEVSWPALDELPEALRPDQHPPVVRHGQFTGPDGRRVFLLNPYTREDARLDIWGGNDPQRRAPDHGLYDPETQGWIYRDLLTAESLCRLGFNSLSVTMPPSPWWQRVGYAARDVADPSLLPQLRDRVQVPFVVDSVCWPWTLGKPAEAGVVTPDSLTRGRHHWVPYRIIGPGRELWLDLWRLYAGRYADANAPVLIFELMNEPAYLPESADHFREFEQWLRERYGSVDALNRTWTTRFETWSDAAVYQVRDSAPLILGQHLDYDECLAGRFASLMREGADAVRGLLPGTLVGMQTMSGYVAQPRDAVWKHRTVPHETVVIAPTGGGSWTRGSNAASPPASVLDAPMAAAPFENELLLALAGDKMIFDNETYLSGQTRADTFNLLWRHVICGVDGLSVFNWSKRGWSWWSDREVLETEADKFPYAALIPLARRTDALRGIHEFSLSIQPLAPEILPKPWGPTPRIAFIHSWDDARRRHVEPRRLDKRGAYYAALTYSHWHMAVVPTDAILERDGLEEFDVAVLAGVAHAERGLPAALQTFVQGGGVLLVGEEPFDRDRYRHPLDTRGLTGCTIGPPRTEGMGTLRLPAGLEPALLTGAITSPRSGRSLHLQEGVLVLAHDAGNAALLTRRALGDGLVYYQGADVIGYPLAKLLWIALLDAAKVHGRDVIPPAWRSADLVDEETGQLATNVLLSRRSYPEAGRHALLLMNQDGYAKSVRVRMPLPSGAWTIERPVGHSPDGKRTVTSTGEAIARQGIPIDLAPGAPAVLMLRAVSQP